FQQSYPPISWIPRIAVSTQPVDETMTETHDAGLTEIGTRRSSRRRISHRNTLPPADPRRAPGAFAGSPQTAEVISEIPADDCASGSRAARGTGGGVAATGDALRSMPAAPGVYRMLDRRGDALYVGKARSLKNRVQNYAHPAALSNRLRRMIAETATVEIV